MSKDEETGTVTQWGTVKEFAARWGISENTVYRWIDEGVIESKRLGPKLLRVRLDAFDGDDA